MKPALGKNTAETEPALILEPRFFQVVNYIEEIGALERIRTSDRLVRRTNKNAGISVITGLAFVAFAGLYITYQD